MPDLKSFDIQSTEFTEELAAWLRAVCLMPKDLSARVALDLLKQSKPPIFPPIKDEARIWCESIQPIVQASDKVYSAVMRIRAGDA